MTEPTNYVDRIVRQLAWKLFDCDAELLHLYALLALAKGVATTEEDVHNAWSVWRTTTHPDHPSLIPFAQLAPDVQALDAKYAEAIREVAAS